MNEIYLKHLLKDYRSYYKKRERVKEKIKTIDDRMQRIPGSIVKMPEENMNSNHESKLIDGITLKGPLLEDYKELSDPIEIVEDVIREERHYAKLLKEKYIDGQTQEWLSAKYYTSPRSINRIIDECVAVHVIRLNQKRGFKK